MKQISARTIERIKEKATEKRKTLFVQVLLFAISFFVGRGTKIIENEIAKMTKCTKRKSKTQYQAYSAPTIRFSSTLMTSKRRSKTLSVRRCMIEPNPILLGDYHTINRGLAHYSGRPSPRTTTAKWPDPKSPVLQNI